MKFEQFIERMENPEKLSGNTDKDTLKIYYESIREKYPDFKPLTEARLVELSMVLKSKDKGTRWIDRTKVALLLRNEIQKRTAFVICGSPDPIEYK